MPPEKETTIYDIAKMLGISASTVSRGLKNHPAVNIKTRKLFIDTAGRMGYRSNNFATSLRKQQTRTIGAIIHELHSEFVISALAGIEKIAEQFARMDPRPDAIFLTNDFCAAVCIQVFKELGLRIPQDIAVVGFNNDTISQLMEPQITTIDYPGNEIGEVAAQCLIDLLDNPTLRS